MVPPRCRYFLQFITQSRNTRNRLDAAKELKKLVFFSNICVAPLLDDLKVRCALCVLCRAVCGGWGRVSQVPLRLDRLEA